ncbi:hypothetical protein ACFX11_006325 [Malus domestica]
MMKRRWGGSRKSDLYSQLTSIILTSSIHLLPWRCVGLARKGERTRSKQKWLPVPNLVAGGVVEIRSLDLALLVRTRGREHFEKGGELKAVPPEAKEKGTQWKKQAGTQPIHSSPWNRLAPSPSQSPDQPIFD